MISKVQQKKDTVNVPAQKQRKDSNPKDVAKKVDNELLKAMLSGNPNKGINGYLNKLNDLKQNGTDEQKKQAEKSLEKAKQDIVEYEKEFGSREITKEPKPKAEVPFWQKAVYFGLTLKLPPTSK